MRDLFKRVACVFALTAGVLAARGSRDSHAQQGQPVGIHDHSSGSKGGSALRPQTVSATTATFTTVVSTYITSPGLYVLVATRAVSGGFTAQFDGLASSVTYRMEYDVFVTTAGSFPQLQLFYANGLTSGANLQRTSNTDGTTEVTASQTSSVNISCHNDLLASRSALRGFTDFHTEVSSTAVIVSMSHVFAQDVEASPNYSIVETYGRGDQSVSANHSVAVRCFACGSATSGTVFLYKRIDPSGFTLGGATGLGSNLPTHQHSATSGDGGATLNPTTINVGVGTAGAADAIYTKGTASVFAETLDAATNQAAVRRFRHNGSLKYDIGLNDCLSSAGAVLEIVSGSCLGVYIDAAHAQAYTSGVSFTVAAASTTLDGAAKINGIVRAAAQPGASVYRTAAMNLPDSAWYSPSWDTEAYDQGGIHSVVTSSDVVTVPAGGAGLYYVQCSASFGGNATGRRLSEIFYNSGTELYSSEVTPNANGTTATSSGVLSLAVGDTVACRFFQSSGGVLAFGVGQGSNSQLVVQKLW